MAINNNNQGITDSQSLGREDGKNLPKPGNPEWIVPNDKTILAIQPAKSLKGYFEPQAEAGASYWDNPYHDIQDTPGTVRNKIENASIFFPFTPYIQIDQPYEFFITVSGGEKPTYGDSYIKELWYTGELITDPNTERIFHIYGKSNIWTYPPVPGTLPPGITFKQIDAYTWKISGTCTETGVWYSWLKFKWIEYDVRYYKDDPTQTLIPVVESRTCWADTYLIVQGPKITPGIQTPNYDIIGPDRKSSSYKSPYNLGKLYLNSDINFQFTIEYNTYRPEANTYTVEVGGDLPTGLGVIFDGGFNILLTGIVSSSGIYFFNITVTDAFGRSSVFTYSLNVIEYELEFNPPSGSQIYTGTQAPLVAGVKVGYWRVLASLIPNASGNLTYPPYRWNILTDLPIGITLKGSDPNGIQKNGYQYTGDRISISENSIPKWPGTYKLIFEVSDSFSGTYSPTNPSNPAHRTELEYDLVVNARDSGRDMFPYVIAEAFPGVPYSQKITQRLLGMQTLDWRLEATPNSSLPPGIKLKYDSTGPVSSFPFDAENYLEGTCTVPGTYNFYIFINGLGKTINTGRYYSLTVLQAPSPLPNAIDRPTIIQNQPWTQSFTVFTSNPPGTITANVVPSGMYYTNDNSSQQINFYGAFENVGNVTFSVDVVDNQLLPQTYTFEYTIEVQANGNISLNPAPPNLPLLYANQGPQTIQLEIVPGVDAKAPYGMSFYPLQSQEFAPNGFVAYANSVITNATVYDLTFNPVTTGNYAFTIGIQDSSTDTNVYGWNQTAYLNYYYEVVEYPVLEPKVVSSVTGNVAYLQIFNIVNPGPDDWTFSSTGNLPANLVFVDNGNNTASISGISTSYGNTQIVVTATNPSRPTLSETYTLFVNQVGGLPEALTTPLAMYSVVNETISIDPAQPGVGPYTFVVQSGGLPPDLEFTDNGNGTATIAGTVNYAGTYDFVVLITDGANSTAHLSYSITVIPNTLTITPTTIKLLNASLFSNYLANIEVSGSQSNISFSIVPFSGVVNPFNILPEGMSLVSTGSNTASIVGAPQVQSSFYFSVQAEDENNSSVVQDYQLLVSAPTYVQPQLPAELTWITPAGSLGTIPEGVYYSVQLNALSAIIGQPVYYRLQAGNLPSGYQVTSTGAIQGVPTAVNRNTYYEFVVRAYVYDPNNSVLISDYVDRTFNLTIADLSQPYFITPPGLLYNYFDGTLIRNLQIQFADPNGDYVYSKIVTGSLPYNLNLSLDGIISGFIYPLSLGQVYNTFSFTVEVTNGRNSVLREFSIGVFNTSYLTADNTYITADTTEVTADAAAQRYPVVTVPEGNLGTYINKQFFAFLFTGFDAYGYPLKWFGLTKAFGTTDGVPNVVIDPDTGWMYGYLPAITTESQTYNFQVQCYYLINNVQYPSPLYNYALTSTGTIVLTVTWLSPSNLGTIVNGGTSIFQVKAVDNEGIPLFYRLYSSAYNSLPQGLILLDNGIIVGRTSLNTFAVDSGSTYFDAGNTTFDMSHTFTVQAYDLSGNVSATKEFTITVIRVFNQPYENLYIQAMPPLEDRALLTGFLNDTNIFPPELIFRPSDPNFGVAKEVVYQHAFGLQDANALEYLNAMQENHYLKTLLLGEIKTAIARNSNGDIVYEVVYSQVIDNLLNNEGESVSKEVVLPYPVDLTNTLPIINIVGDGADATISIPLPPAGIYPPPPAPYAAGQNITVTGSGNYDGDYIVLSCVSGTIVVSSSVTDAYAGGGTVTGANPNPIATVFPNSLINMRQQIIDSIGEISNQLPLWMYSKQLDDTVLGFTPAWVIAYTQPGASGIIAYNAKETIGNKLNIIDFNVDRYELDSELSKNWWSSVTQSITNITATGSEVRFYYEDYGMPSYIPNQTITISGVNPTQYNGTYVVTNVGSGYVAVASTTYGTYISGGKIVGTGTWVPNPPVYTTFDVNYHYSFIPTVQIDGGTGYAVGDILRVSGALLGGVSPANDVTIVVNTVTDTGAISGINATGPVVNWINNNNQLVTWVNNSDQEENWVNSPTYIIGAWITEGLAPPTAAGQQFPDITPETITGSGSGAVMSFETVPGQATIFDKGSLQFVIPVDEYDDTNMYDKYLLFPHRTILG